MTYKYGDVCYSPVHNALYMWAMAGHISDNHPEEKFPDRWILLSWEHSVSSVPQVCGDNVNFTPQHEARVCL